MDKVAKFDRKFLIVEGLIKEKVGDGGKLAKIGKTKDLVELWKGLIERKIKFEVNFVKNGRINKLMDLIELWIGLINAIRNLIE
jgi:hypothetical protein